MQLPILTRRFGLVLRLPGRIGPFDRPVFFVIDQQAVPDLVVGRLNKGIVVERAFLCRFNCINQRCAPADPLQDCGAGRFNFPEVTSRGIDVVGYIVGWVKVSGTFPVRSRRVDGPSRGITM